jgi:hypothetical protein
MSERTGMSISQVTDEVLYTGLVEMRELPEHEELVVPPEEASRQKCD